MKLLARIGILLLAAAIVIGGALLLDSSGLIASSGLGEGRFEGGERSAFVPGAGGAATQGEVGARLGRPARGERPDNDGAGEFRGEGEGGVFTLRALLPGLLGRGAQVALIALMVALLQWLAGRLTRRKKTSPVPA